MFAGNEPTVSFFDLERAVDRRKLGSPEQTLSQLTGLVVIDEIQRQPQLFESLRVLLDGPACMARFLLLGSADALARESEETSGQISKDLRSRQRAVTRTPGTPFFRRAVGTSKAWLII